MKRVLWVTVFLIAGLTSVNAETAATGHPVYTISFSKDLKVAEVTARLILAENRIRMASWGHPYLPQGWATFVHGLKVTDRAGQPIDIDLIDDGWGAWSVAAENGQTLNLHYQVHFDHHQYDWNPAGGQDSRPAVASGALFLVTKALFIYSPNTADATVNIQVPDGWTVSTPWLELEAHPGRYHAPSWISLVNNALVVGRHGQYLIRNGNMTIVLALDDALADLASLFQDTFEKQLESYRQVFDGTPETRYLMTLRAADEDDGESFQNSFNQVITNDQIPFRQVVWASTMGHELFHYWNGNHFLVGKNKEDVEWFGEGFTEYYASLTLLRVGLIDEALYYKKLERYFARLHITRRMWPAESISLVAAGQDKAANWLLLYGGGATIALLLDIEIRALTQGTKGLDEVMRLMTQRSDDGHNPFDVADVLATVNEVSNSDFTAFFDDYVLGSEKFPPLKTTLAKAGLHLDQFSDEFYIRRLPNPSSEQRAIYRGLTGVAGIPTQSVRTARR